jgi:hypothetical protein
MISAEMIGFKILDPYFQNCDSCFTGIQFFANNSRLNSISNIDRGQYMYTGTAAQARPLTYYEAGPYEFYVKYSSLSYFLAFIGILFLQSFTIFIVDIFWLKHIPSTVTLWEKIVHAIQKSHLPFPFANWHEGKGSCLDHIKRKNLVEKEVLAATIVNLAFNMVMLIPMVILCKVKNLLNHIICSFRKNHFRSRDIGEA